MAIAWAIGAGVGLALLAGSRSFIPLAVYMLFARLGWVWGFHAEGTAFDFILSNAAIAVLLALAVAEILLTRLRALAAAAVILRLPIAAVAGAVLLIATVSAETSAPLYYIGLPAGALLAMLGVYVHKGLVMAGEGADPGPALDFSVVVLSCLMMLVPPAGYLLGAVILWLAWRVRKLKRLKYKGLRVLA